MPSIIYLDNHATTPVDPRVIETMLPWFGSKFANPGSSTHEAGRSAKEEMDGAWDRIASYFNVAADEVVVTSGATESNNLALLGIANHPRQKRRKIVTVSTEHQATLGPVAKLKSQGFEIVHVPVITHASENASESGTTAASEAEEAVGVVDMQYLEDAIDDETALVSVMLANNEIGVLQPVQKIAAWCDKFGVPLHTDATQAVGRIPLDADSLGANLISFSAHKFYGPKGIGGLIVRNTSFPLRLAPQIVGGGQQHNLRSGTLNSAGIIAMAAAIDCLRTDATRDYFAAYHLRQRLWERLKRAIPGLMLNGPVWSPLSNDTPRDGWPQGETNADWNWGPICPYRLSNNLNVCFPKVDGQSLMLEVNRLAVSSGSACTSAHPEPSHVLRGIGRSEDQARSSLRFGIGRFNTEPEIDEAVDLLVAAYKKLESFVA